MIAPEKVYKNGHKPSVCPFCAGYERGETTPVNGKFCQCLGEGKRAENSSSLSPPLSKNDDDDGFEDGVVWFSKRDDPKPREFLVEDLIPSKYPTVLFGGGGVAKSVLAMLLGIAVAGHSDEWLGLAVKDHGTALYLDFELDADEQHRRALGLAEGMGVSLPDNLAYVSALGMRTQRAFRLAYDVCVKREVKLMILDSLGPAMMGDAEKAGDVIAFHNRYLAPFRAAGVTVVIVDHMGKVQAGESYQNKASFGSSYKEHLSRSVIQVEAGHRETGTLTVRLRHKKTNFGTRRDPFDVRLTFDKDSIAAEPVELDSVALAGESTLNAVDRVKAALEDGPAYPDELAESTGLAFGTVKNCLTQLRKAGIVEETGETSRGQGKRVKLSSSLSLPYRDNYSDDSFPADKVSGYAGEEDFG